MTTATPLLLIRRVSKRFGGLQAVNNVSLEIAPGSIYGLIGPNGAGKTTLFNLITGLYPADHGEFILDGMAYEPSSVHRVTEAGVARTFQNIRLFPDLSAIENVMVGRHVRTHGLHSGILGAVLRTAAFKRIEQEIRDHAEHLLDYVGLGSRSLQTARTLSYGDQRRLEIARALATEPKLLALDEPAAGMNATEKNTLRSLLERIQADGKTILLIEHDVRLVMGLCGQVTVLDHGEVIACGSPAEVQRNPSVSEAYLGTGATHG